MEEPSGTNEEIAEESVVSLDLFISQEHCPSTPLRYARGDRVSLILKWLPSYFPLHFGSRFSIQAVIPSRASSVFISSPR